MDRIELRRWTEDALERHDRDARERGETIQDVTVPEIVDAVWGRIPLEVRRQSSRAQVQASLTMLTLRRGIVLARGEGARASAATEAPPVDEFTAPELEP